MSRVSYFLDPYSSDSWLDQSSKIVTWGTNILTGKGETWLNFKGYFSLEMLYKRMYEWLSEYGFTDIDGQKDKIEHYFHENRGADGFVKEIWYWWRTEKTPDNNPMFRYRIFIDVQLLALTTEEVVIEGQKFKQNYGEISIFFRPMLMFELKNKSGKPFLKSGKTWDENFVTKNTMNWFQKRAYNDQIEQRKSELYTQFNDLYAIIKQYLQLNNYQAPRKDMHPQKGISQYKL